MRRMDEKWMAEAVTRYIDAEKIDPDQIDLIKVERKFGPSCRITVILKPLINCPYKFDLSVDFPPKI